MILIYAPGEGLGHLTRVRAAIHTLGLKSPIAVVTDSPSAVLVLPDTEILPLPQLDELQHLVDAMRPDALYVDAFPGGLQGEICGLRFSGPVYHLARILKWSAYRNAAPGPLPFFQKTFVLEPLTQGQWNELAGVSGKLESLTLRDPGDSNEFPASIEAPDSWLVVHSGPVEECRELLEYAQQMVELESVNPNILFIGPHSIDGVVSSNYYPATSLFPRATRIITACGFNSMRQTEPYAAIHRFLPFPRRFDDQFRRASLHRNRRRQMLDNPTAGASPAK